MPVTNDKPAPYTSPKDGKGWTQAQRDKFIVTFGAVVDFCFPIVEKETPKTPENEGES